MSPPALARIRGLDLGLSAAGLARLLPSGRWLVGGFVILALAVAAYEGARTSSVFSVQRIEVAGLPAADAAAARRALAPLEGRSLVALRRAELDRRLAAIPGISSFTYDRAFPNTLVVQAVAEEPLAVVRRGEESWLVSRRGRVLRPVRTGTRLELPRVWLPRRVNVSVGATLPDDAGGSAVRALALLQAADASVRARTVRMGDEVTYVLRSGLELRLGSMRAVELKLAVAATVLGRLDGAARYLDVSVPSRPVVGGRDSQPEG